LIETENPIFTSYSSCATGGYTDFADGYGCVYGLQPYTGEDLGRSGLYDDVLEGLGVPIGGTGNPANVLFLCGSGILHERGLRLDCGCLVVDCGGTGEGESFCSSDLFLDNDDLYDWDCDHLRLEIRLLEEEPIGVCSNQVDGTIPSMLELV
jgi:hypothetical protein